jgi:hypothetical protein
MPSMNSVPGSRARRLGLRAAAISVSLAAVAGLGSPAQAASPSRGRGAGGLQPGNLLISRSVYDTPSITPGVTTLPAGCVTGCALANSDGTYPYVWNNDLVDPSFGVTSRIYLDQVTPLGLLLGSIPSPATIPLPIGLLGSTVDVPADQLVTSFPSKSEIALNQSTNGQDVTFMAYVAPDAALDVSNSNTPGAFDPTNPVPGSNYRVVADIDSSGQWHFTETNAYSGNNGRAAILDNTGGANLIFAAGNAGNGANPQPDGIILGAGAQLIQPSSAAESAQTPGPPTPVASFNITQLGVPHDKIGKDDNFRGLTISNNVLYYTKGSGSNGVNTVYFVDTTGRACPNGTGLPEAGAPLPSSPLAYDPTKLQKNGLPSNMCILRGFPTQLAKNTTDSFPFGLWFADPHTLYVADEGNGDTTFSGGQYTTAAGQSRAGLQKWVFDAGSASWKLAYTLQGGLDLGQPYTVAGYPTGSNPNTGLPWAPATDGLRNITGQVHRDGTATIWGVTSTVSGSGDQGADPNKVVAITDGLRTASPPTTERFRTVRSAGFAEVLRGVSFTPGTSSLRCDEFTGC